MFTENLVANICRIAKVRSKRSGLVIQVANKFESDRDTVSTLRELDSIVIGVGRFRNLSDAVDSVKYALEKVDHVFFDVDWPKFDRSVFSGLTQIERLFYYSDLEVWAESIVMTISECLKKRTSQKILLVGDDPLSKSVYQKLCNLKLDVVVSDGKLAKSESFDLIAGVQLGTTVVGPEYFPFLKKDSFILDGGIGSLSQDLIDQALNADISVFRVDNKASLSGKIVGLLETQEQIGVRMGRDLVAGFGVVAGGAMGKKDDVVVDSIANPTFVFGVADGRGRFIPPSEEVRRKEEEFKKLLRTPLGKAV